MKIFLGLVPSFYRVELWNRISSEEDILVVMAGWYNDGREADFYESNFSFPCEFLKGSLLNKVITLIKLLSRNKYDEFCISGWGYPIMYIASFLSPKIKNSVVVESSCHESAIRGVKGLLKKLFVTRVSKAYVSGTSQEKLIMSLGFKGNVIKTKGVGVFNYHPQPAFRERICIRKFIWVGRFIPEKNIRFLVERFSEHPELELTLVGNGPLLEDIRALAPMNVHIIGYVENIKLPSLYSDHDVLVLPSLSEAWGLVVEEAMNNGLPVLVSDKVGCAEELVTKDYGRVFEVDSVEDFERKLKEICEPKTYNRIAQNISRLDFEKIEEDQVMCYVG